MPPLVGFHLLLASSWAPSQGGPAEALPWRAPEPPAPSFALSDSPRLAVQEVSLSTRPHARTRVPAFQHRLGTPRCRHAPHTQHTQALLTCGRLQTGRTSTPTLAQAQHGSGLAKVTSHPSTARAPSSGLQGAAPATRVLGALGTFPHPCSDTKCLAGQGRHFLSCPRARGDRMVLLDPPGGLAAGPLPSPGWSSWQPTCLSAWRQVAGRREGNWYIL